MQLLVQCTDIGSNIGFYAANNGSLLPTFRYNLSASFSSVKQSEKNAENTLRSRHFFLECLTLENGTDTLFRNVCNKLQFYARQNPKRAQIPSCLHLHFYYTSCGAFAWVFSIFRTNIISFFRINLY